MNAQAIKQFPFGVPLTLSGVATVATMFANKRLHVACGVVWGVLSILHAIQHRGKIKADMSRFCHAAEHAAGKAEVTTLGALLAGTDIASFIPGRMRVYTLALADNEKLAQQLTDYIKTFTGVTDASANLVTGSMLITYEPEELRKNPHLKHLETYIAEHAKIK